MRLIDADELMEHVWRDRLDSRERIAGMIDREPTVHYSMFGDAVYILKHCVMGACIHCSNKGNCEKEENIDAALGVAIRALEGLKQKG